MIGTIIFNKDKKLAVKLKEEYEEFFKEKKIKIVPLSQIKEAEFVVVIGGDGTLLRGTQKILENKNIDIFAVNAGSLGFLTEIKMDEFKKVFNNYLIGKKIVEERSLLNIEFKGKQYDFLNEVVISKKDITSKIVDILLETKKHKILKYKADGLIIATSTGSTAYSLSVGGPILMPQIEAMVVTPIASHNFSSRSIILDPKEDIFLSLTKEDEGVLIIDGDIKLKIKKGEQAKIGYSKKKIRLVIPEERDYYNILRNKLKWGDNLC